jgi:hypothetical protein
VRARVTSPPRCDVLAASREAAWYVPIMIKSLVYLVVAVIIVYASTAIGIGTPHRLVSTGWPYSTSSGQLTLVGHIRAIWHTDEVQDLEHGIEDKTRPVIKDIKHEVHEVTTDDSKN